MGTISIHSNTKDFVKIEWFIDTNEILELLQIAVRTKEIRDKLLKIFKDNGIKIPKYMEQNIFQWATAKTIEDNYNDETGFGIDFECGKEEEDKVIQ